METDHHRIDRSTRVDVARRHHLDIDAFECFANARTSAHQNPFARSHQARTGHRRGDDVARRFDADSGESGALIGDGRRRVVGHEQNPMACFPQSRHGVARTRDRTMGQPHHSIEITQNHRTHRVVILPPEVTT